MSSIFFMSVLVPLSILLPISTALLKFRQLTSTARVILFYLVVSAIVSVLAIYIGRVLHTNNYPLLHLYTVIELAIFTWFYQTLLQPRESKKKLYLILVAVFVCLSIINAFIQGIHHYSSYTRTLEAFICILFALNFYARMASNDLGKKNMVTPDFYFNTGIFLYFSGAFMFFIFSNFIIHASSHVYNVLFVINAALVLVMYLIFTAGFILCRA